MTLEEQRIAIAEACGWHLAKEHEGLDIPLNLQCWRNKGVECFGNYLPDYLNDLNAMHGAIKALTKEQFYAYYWNLIENFEGKDIHPIEATAAQRAEAFLKTIGKWE